MTTRTPTSLLALILVSCATPPTGDTSAPPDAAAGSPSDWMATVGARVEAAGRAIRAVNGEFVVDLSPAGLSGRFDDAGVVFTDVETGEPALGLRLTAWGREGALRPPEPAAPDLGECGPDVDPTGACIRQLEHPRGDGLTEWWLGQPNGVEQGWTLDRAPAGTGDLRFEIALDEVLGLDGEGPALSLTDARGRDWTIDGVVAWDAHGEPLPAEARFEGEALVVTVDDTGAVYPVTVDPVYTTAAWHFASVGYFGQRVDGAGDVNGDGYDDVVVSTTNTDSGSGAAWVFHGSPTGLSGTASVRLEGETVSSYFGQAVAGAGDVDGDGYDDLVVGAYEYGDGAGRVYVFHGSASGLSAVAATTLTGSVVDAQLGYSVAAAGDVNDDGYDDVIVGAPATSSSTGRAYVHHGSASGLVAAPTTTLMDGSAGGRFGFSTAGAGDVNGDGYDDVIVGAVSFGSSSGRAYVFHGGATGVGWTIATTIASDTGGVQLGYAVGTAGDVDADGYDDVFVSAPAHTSSTGKVYVHHGSASGISTTATTTLVGFSTGNYFGSSATPVGDLEGDGYDDLVVGSWGYSGGAGRVTVYYGTAAGVNSIAVATYTGTTSDRLGISVRRSGDVNADGYPDLIVGSYDGAYVFHGSAGGLPSTATRTIEAPPSFDYVNVAGAGDLDGDGYDDIVVGSEGYSGGTGEIYVFYGDAAGPSDFAADTVLIGAAGSYIAENLVAAGDVDNDGYDDLVFGAPSASSSTGRVYLYRGSPSGLEGSPTSTISGTASYDYFGYALAPVGDTNRDGYGDLLIGAYGAGTGGAAYLYLGSSGGLSTSAASSFSVVATDVQHGKAVASGDFDGDGNPDAAVAAPRTASSGGQVTLYRGTASGIATTAWRTLSGEAASNYFGSTIEAADIDGDGYDDLIVGAYGYDSNRGKIYVYYGGTSGVSALPATTISGTTTADYLGEALAAVGDVDADGYDDIAVGTYRYSSNSGRLQLFRGSPPGLDSSPSMTVTGAANNQYLGLSVSSAGDVNGDGFDDVLVGGSAHAWIFRGYDADSDADGSPDSVDCDDADSTVYVGATEVCDGVDQDCDGVVDDGVGTTLYADDDGDGYGDASTSFSSCSTTAPGHVTNADDCDDTRAGVSPAATEVCGGGDEDCDGASDEEGATGGTAWYADTDGDSFGGDTVRMACTAPSGFVATNTDCDDTTATTNPSATETCNGADDDCDGATDESGSTGEATWYADADGDGAGAAGTSVRACTAPSGYVATATDCNDGAATVHVGATEACNSVDDDCDGTVDDGVTTTWYYDADGDGHAGTIGAEACTAPTGHTATATDCDDTSAAVSPTAAETCDGVDQDCDGSVDEGAAATWHRDADRDGFGDASVTTASCTEPAGYVVDASDCDDASAGVYPGALERCDELDNDCDSVADEDVTPFWYRDTDGDGFGWAAASVAECTQPEGYVANADDCDDADVTLTEGLTGYRDADGDGFGDAAVSTFGCALPSGYVSDATDCDDALATVYPGAAESWYDGVDQDCDGNDTDQDGDGASRDDDCDDTDASVVTCDTATDTDTDTQDDTGNTKTEDPACGCSSSTGPGAGAVLVGLVALATARRRRS